MKKLQIKLAIENWMQYHKKNFNICIRGIIVIADTYIFYISSSKSVNFFLGDSLPSINYSTLKLLMLSSFFFNASIKLQFEGCKWCGTIILIMCVKCNLFSICSLLN